MCRDGRSQTDIARAVNSRRGPPRRSAARTRQKWLVDAPGLVTLAEDGATATPRTSRSDSASPKARRYRADVASYESPQARGDRRHEPVAVAFP